MLYLDAQLLDLLQVRRDTGIAASSRINCMEDGQSLALRTVQQQQLLQHSPS